MIALVPVSKFRVPYEIARGRPYSGLERAVLDAVGDGGATLSSLKSAFRIHERLLVEAAVTLVTAGWVAVVGGSETQFALTAAGRAALDTDRDPVSVVVRSARPQTIVMERLTGQVARQSEARWWSKRDLRDIMDGASILRERIVRNSLDEAQVKKMLPRGNGEWVRRIGPIGLVSRQTHYVPVEVDLESGTTHGLPSQWQRTLSGHILRSVIRPGEESRNRGSSASARDLAKSKFRAAERRGVESATRNRTTAMRLRYDELVIGVAGHRSAFETALASARTSVAVISPMADESGLVQAAELAESAIKRGLHVDLLFGATSENTSARGLVGLANELGYRFDHQDGRARLRTRDAVTGSGASILIYDDASRRLVALVSDFPWLDSAATGRPVGLTVTQQSLCADVARAVSSLWTGRDGHDGRWSAHGERWNALATAAEDEAAAAEAVGALEAVQADVEAELLIDDEIASMDDEVMPVARVGGAAADTNGGDGALRGLVIRISGNSATIVSEAQSGRS